MNDLERSMVTMQQALAICGTEGYPVASSTWRKKVGSQQAPQPVHRRGRTPLWDREQVQQWAREQAGHHAAVQGWALSEAPQVQISLPELSPLHGVQIDPMTPGLDALEDLRHRLDEREQELARAMTKLERRTAIARDRELDAQEALAEARGVRRALAMVAGWSHRRQSAEYSGETAHALEAVEVAHAACVRDLEAVDRAIAAVVQWGDHQKEVIRRRTEEAELAEEEAKRPALLEQYVTRVYPTPAQFVQEDRRRLSWGVTPGPGTPGVSREEAIALLEAGEPVRLVLGGADYGFDWRFEGADWSPPVRPGRWRVSWLYESTGEVYAVHREPHRWNTDPWNAPPAMVLLLGHLESPDPRGEMWLADQVRELEARQDEPGSLLLIAEAIAQLQNQDEPDHVHG